MRPQAARQVDDVRIGLLGEGQDGEAAFQGCMFSGLFGQYLKRDMRQVGCLPQVLKLG
jgi:hypothetical protein